MRTMGAAIVTMVSTIALAGCFGGDSAPEPTPGDALAGLQEASAELLGVAAPGNDFDEIVPDRGTPCGGLGGNEWNKVQYPYSAGAGIVEDQDEALSRALAAAEALDLRPEADDVVSPLPTMSFAGEGFRGDLTIQPSGAIQVHAQTDCLDNPDR